jgi:hypothetical protein
MPRLGQGCGTWRTRAGGSATAACMFFCEAEGWAMDRKSTQRICREEGLAVRRRRSRRRIAVASRRSRGRRGRTAAGRSTSCTTSWPRGAASGC